MPPTDPLSCTCTLAKAPLRPRKPGETGGALQGLCSGRYPPSPYLPDRIPRVPRFVPASPPSPELRPTHASFACGIRPYAPRRTRIRTPFFEGGDFFFLTSRPFRRRWTKRARTATRAAATKDAPMARWCFTIPVSSGCAAPRRPRSCENPDRAFCTSCLHGSELVARRVERGLDLAAAAQAEHGHDAVDGLPARGAASSCDVCTRVALSCWRLSRGVVHQTCVRGALFAGERLLAELILLRHRKHTYRTHQQKAFVIDATRRSSQMCQCVAAAYSHVQGRSTLACNKDTRKHPS